jgi:hypothetical protein
MSDGLHTVHIRVNDAASGKPTPVRLRCRGPDGTYYAPFGRLREFSTAPAEDVGGNLLLHSKRYAYIDGTCEIRLPSGQLFIMVHKGPEYNWLNQEVMLGVGQMAIRLAIDRNSDLREEGWYSGDARCHFLPPPAALLEAAAEDLAVVNLLAVEYQVNETINAIPNILAFSGQTPALEMPGHMVVVNTFNQHPVLGCVSLLNSHRMVYPLVFGGAKGVEDWTVSAWCDQCHRKGGLVVWANVRPPNEPQLLAGELPADAILGKIDALEVVLELPADWYTLLEAGYRLPLVGASAKTSNRELLGAWRTYARLTPGESFSLPNWIEAIRGGRTFITRGPLLMFSVNEQDPGATVEVAAGQKLRVRAEVRNPLPSDRIEVLLNGAVVAERVIGDEIPALLEAEIAADDGGWLAARYQGHEPGREGVHVLAHASPVYLSAAGKPARATPAAKARLQQHLETMLAWVRDEGRFETDKQHEDLAGLFRAAQEKLNRG